MIKMKITKLVDLRSERCPIPLILTKRALAELVVDDVIELVLATKADGDDILKMIAATEHILLNQFKGENGIHMIIKKGDC